MVAFTKIFGNVLHFFISKDTQPLCSNGIDKCYGQIQHVPDPKDFDLPEDFIFLKKEWGSMFYKHIGKHTGAEAKRLCSVYGDSVHLPIPRSQEENEFYRKYFADESLWLDIFRMSDGHFKSSYEQLFVGRVKTWLGDIEYFKMYDWINISHYDSDFVILVDDGQWNTTDGLNQRDSVCVFNILSHEHCPKCPDDKFCRFKNETRQEIECICPIDRKGEFCQDKICSHCENGGYCRFDDEDSNRFDCVCPKPFHGENCTETRKNISK